VLTQFNPASLHRHQETYHFDAFGAGSSTFFPSCSSYQNRSKPRLYQGTVGAVRRKPQPFSRHQGLTHPYSVGRPALSHGFPRHSSRRIWRTIRRLRSRRFVLVFPRVEGLGLMLVVDDLSIQQFVESPKIPRSLRAGINPFVEGRLRTPSTINAACVGGYLLLHRPVLVEALNKFHDGLRSKEVDSESSQHQRLFAYSRRLLEAS